MILNMDEFIKDFVNEENLKLSAQLWCETKEEGIIDSIKSAIIGHLYGDALAHYIENIDVPLQAEDLNEFKKLYFKRIIELDEEITENINYWVDQRQ
jgi:hypothetical protein